MLLCYCYCYYIIILLSCLVVLLSYAATVIPVYPYYLRYPTPPFFEKKPNKAKQSSGATPLGRGHGF